MYREKGGIMNPGSLAVHMRLQRGWAREEQIAEALVKAGLNIQQSSQFEDRHLKIDRWIVTSNERIPLQIKYREKGGDLLFEVYDKWYGWEDPRNKLGRDMYGDAKEYAVLLPEGNRNFVAMVPTDLAKEIVWDMVNAAKEEGFDCETERSKTLNYWDRGCNLQLKVQHDPCDNRQKMVAYIPSQYFGVLGKIKTFNVELPSVW